MIVTKLQQHLLELYAERHLGRKLTLDEMRRVLLYNKNRLDFVRNKYYRETNKIIEDAIKEIKNENIGN